LRRFIARSRDASAGGISLAVGAWCVLMFDRVEQRVQEREAAEVAAA
jgi:hypothetical protein